MANDSQILAGSIATKLTSIIFISVSAESRKEKLIYFQLKLQKLKLPANSVKELLKILEQNALSKGYDEEYQKFSTHLFLDVIKLLIIPLNEKFNYDEIPNEFNFIKAKFLGLMIT